MIDIDADIHLNDNDRFAKAVIKISKAPPLKYLKNSTYLKKNYNANTNLNIYTSQIFEMTKLLNSNKKLIAPSNIKMIEPPKPVHVPNPNYFLDQKLIDIYSHDDCISDTYNMKPILYLYTCEKKHAIPIYCGCARDPTDFINTYLLIKKNYTVQLTTSETVSNRNFNESHLQVIVNIKCTQCDTYYNSNNYLNLMADCPIYNKFCNAIKSFQARILNEFLLTNKLATRCAIHDTIHKMSIRGYGNYMYYGSMIMQKDSILDIRQIEFNNMGNNMHTCTYRHPHSNKKCNLTRCATCCLKYPEMIQKKYHDGKSCYEVQKEWLLANNTNRFSNEELADLHKLNIQMCPVCKILTEKTGSCDKMHCTSCDTNFCFVCAAELNLHDPYTSHLVSKVMVQNGSEMALYSCPSRQIKSKTTEIMFDSTLPVQIPPVQIAKADDTKVLQRPFPIIHDDMYAPVINKKKNAIKNDLIDNDIIDDYDDEDEWFGVAPDDDNDDNEIGVYPIQGKAINHNDYIKPYKRYDFDYDIEHITNWGPFPQFQNYPNLEKIKQLVDPVETKIKKQINKNKTVKIKNELKYQMKNQKNRSYNKMFQRRY